MRSTSQSSSCGSLIRRNITQSGSSILNTINNYGNTINQLAKAQSSEITNDNFLKAMITGL